MCFACTRVKVFPKKEQHKFLFTPAGRTPEEVSAQELESTKNRWLRHLMFRAKDSKNKEYLRKLFQFAFDFSVSDASIYYERAMSILRIEGDLVLDETKITAAWFLKQALKLDPLNIEYYYALANIYDSLDNYVGCYRTIEMALSQFPSLPKMNQNPEQKAKLEEQLSLYKDKLPCQVSEISIVTMAQQMASAVTYINTLPDDMLSSIFCLLPVQDVLQVGKVCKQWRNIVQKPHFTKSFLCNYISGLEHMIPDHSEEWKTLFKTWEKYNSIWQKFEWNKKIRDHFSDICGSDPENVVDLFGSITTLKEEMTAMFEILNSNAAVSKDWCLFYFFHNGLDMKLVAGDEKLKVTIYPAKLIEKAKSGCHHRSFSIFDVFRKVVKPKYEGKYHIGHIRCKFPIIKPHNFYAYSENYSTVEKHELAIFLDLEPEQKGIMSQVLILRTAPTGGKDELVGVFPSLVEFLEALYKEDTQHLFRYTLEGYLKDYDEEKQVVKKPKKKKYLSIREPKWIVYRKHLQGNFKR